METIKYITIESFDHRSQADILMMLLHQDEIPARLADEHVVAMEWALAAAVGGIKVQVPHQHQDQATEIAMQFREGSRPRSHHSGQSGELEENESCLACGTSMPQQHTTCTHCGWSYL